VRLQRGNAPHQPHIFRCWSGIAPRIKNVPSVSLVGVPVTYSHSIYIDKADSLFSFQAGESSLHIAVAVCTGSPVPDARNDAAFLLTAESGAGRN
jgi:hypothetical protein